MIKLAIIYLIFGALNSNAIFYEDRRCSCICPGLEKVANIRLGKTYLRDNIPASQCNCEEMVLPRIGHLINGSTLAFCMKCECKYEMRSTAVIMVVVVFLCWVLCLLLLYMICLYFLNAVTNNLADRAHNIELRLQEETTVLVNAPGTDSEHSDSEVD